MNSDTGKVYDTLEEVEKAERRGEKVVSVSKRVARFVKDARLARAVQLRKRCEKNRKADKVQKLSRRNNR